MAQARRWTGCCREIDRTLDGRLRAAELGRRLHRAAAQARSGGGSRRRHARGDRRAARAPTTSETEPLVAHYRTTRERRRDPRRPTDQRGLRRRSRTRWSRSAATPMIFRKSPGDRKDGRRRPCRRRHDRLARRAHQARRDDGELDASRPTTSVAGRHVAVQGYRGYPASICTSPNAMVVHGIPARYALDEGDILSVDVGVTLDGFVADSAFTFPVGEISPEARAPARRLPGRARGRHRAGRPGTASPTSRTQCRPRPRRRATRSSAASSGTGSAAPCTRTPSSRTTARRDAALARAGHDVRGRADDHRRRPEVVRARRPVVDLDRRQVAFRPFRAHRGRHRRGPGHPDHTRPAGALLP